MQNEEEIGLWQLLVRHRDSPADAEPALRTWLDAFIAKGLADPEGNILSRFSTQLLLPGDYIPQPVIDAVVAVIPSDRFCQHEHAAGLINAFSLEGRLFSEAQKEQLLGALVSSYNRMSHWYTQFCVTEFLGDSFPDPGTFKFARQLDREAIGHGRRFIPQLHQVLPRRSHPPRVPRPTSRTGRRHRRRSSRRSGRIISSAWRKVDDPPQHR